MLPENQPANSPNVVNLIWQQNETLPAITKATKGINLTSYETLIARLKSKVNELPNGLTYALLTGDKSSTTEAIVLFCPFANDVAENMLVRGELVRRAVADQGIIDDAGSPLPLLVIGSPSGSRGLKLTSSQIRDLNDSLSYFAGSQVGLARNLGFREIDLLGFSQGAAMAIAAATEAPRLGLKVRSLAVGDPPNVTARSLFQLLKDFKAENKHLEDDVRSSHIDASTKAYKLDLDGFQKKINPYLEVVKFAWAVLRKRRVNLAIAGHLAKDDFEYRLADLLQTNPDYRPVIAFGGDSLVTPKESLIEAANRVMQGFGLGHFELIEVEGAHHTWVDNPKLLARLCIRGFGR